MLNVTLTINILIDGASRISEIISSSVEDWKKQKFLRWRDLEFYAVPTDNGSPTIFIRILSIRIKNQAHNPDGWKEFIVHLLPANLIFQDTCRLLVFLALYERRFRDFTTWDELMSCKPSRDGSQIRLDESCLALPVISSGTFKNEGLDVREALPWMYNELQSMTEPLALLTGFREKFSLTALRRGDAFALEKHCKNVSTARTLMGHHIESRTLEQYYLSKTSVTDTQAVFRHLSPTDLTLFSSLRLGRCTDAPTTLSQEGREAVLSSPSYLEALEDLKVAGQACVDAFGSIKAAHRDASGRALSNACNRARRRKNTLLNALLRKKFFEEREAYISEATAAKPTIQGSFLQGDGSVRNTDAPIVEIEAENIEGLDVSLFPEIFDMEDLVNGQLIDFEGLEGGER